MFGQKNNFFLFFSIFSLRNKITLRTHSDSYYQEGDAHQALPEDHGTSHISVIDRWGNAVSITTTLNIALD